MWYGAGRRAQALASIVGMGLLFAGSAQAANPPVNLASDASFSVLAGSTVTNTGPTTMFGDLGLDPGSSVTGAPHALGAMHINDGVAIQAKSDLVTAFNDAAGRPSTQLSSADLSGQSFTPGVYNASSSLLFSAGAVTLNAQGDPNAVFIFKVASSLTTGSATTVRLTNGAQPCNVFWQIGASATLGTDSRFAGTVMALTTITAQTGATDRRPAAGAQTARSTSTRTRSRPRRARRPPEPAAPAGPPAAPRAARGGTGGTGGDDRRHRRHDDTDPGRIGQQDQQEEARRAAPAVEATASVWPRSGAPSASPSCGARSGCASSGRARIVSTRPPARRRAPADSPGELGSRRRDAPEHAVPFVQGRRSAPALGHRSALALRSGRAASSFWPVPRAHGRPLRRSPPRVPGTSSPARH